MPAEEVLFYDPKPNTSSAQRMVYCPQARSLLEEFAGAVREMISLHERQLGAIIDNDPEASRFDLLVHYALEKKQNAKYAYIGHLEAHGCGPLSDETDQR